MHIAQQQLLVIADLVTVLTVFDPDKKETLTNYLDRLTSDIMSSSYNGLKIFVGVPLEHHLSETRHKNVKLFTYNANTKSANGKIWRKMLQHSDTPYILIGRRLDAFHGEWTNLERSIRLIGDTGIGAVAGAIRNSTG